jgi:isopentenyl diphosphate isomerase/L-lactate dehydrogenase-like FMN-dependent dehydrogenase
VYSWLAAQCQLNYRQMKNVCCIEDLRRLAHRKVPRAIFDYAAAGSYSQQTLLANVADLARINLRQRVMIDVSTRDVSTTMLGEPVSLPLGLAPVGMTGLQHGNGEILACRAAQRAGIPFTISTLSICSIEDVAAVVDKPFWFQLYVMKDRGFVRSLMERAIAAKCSALMRPLGAPFAQDRQSAQHDDQAALGVRRVRRQALVLRQPGRSGEGCSGRLVAGAMDQNPV